MKGFVALLTLQLCHSLFVRVSFLRLESRSPCHASLAGHSHGGNGLRAAPGAEEAEARRDAPGGRAVRPRQVGWRLCGSPSPAQLLADPPSWSLKAPFSKIYWRPPRVGSLMRRPISNAMTFKWECAIAPNSHSIHPPFLTMFSSFFVEWLW